MKKLTSKQEKVLTEIKKFIAKNGFSPSIRELCTACNLRSSATMFVHLKTLTEKGYINQTKGKFRTIELNVKNEYLNNDEDVVLVPLLGNISAGNLNEAIENPDEYFSIPTSLLPKNKDVFTLLVKGDSMINAGIYDKDIVIIEKTNEAKNKDIIVAMSEENEVTLKRFFKEKNYIRLKPENDLMDDIILPNVTVLGKVIGLYRKI